MRSPIVIRNFMFMKETNFAEELVKYDAPQVEVIEVEVEKGFAVSGEAGDMPIN